MANIENYSKIPECLSKELFKKAIQNGLGLDNVEIDDLKISIASVIGENYTSVIYRAHVKYHAVNKTSQEIFLIVKSMIMAESFTELMDEVQVFQKEIMMYNEILPRIEKLYKNCESFAPRCFYVENKPTHRIIVLEDLKPLGYTVADRIKRLDEVHSKILLQKLGRYHAGTIVLSEKEPDIFKFFDKGFYQPASFNLSPFQTMFKEGIEQFIEYVSEWEGYGIIAEKLKNVTQNFKQKVFKYLSSKPNEIRVLNHSDLWTNNLMFKYDNGKACDLNFIDFQVSTNGSFAMDVHYFLNTSVDFDLLENKRDELLKHYYNAFINSLTELNYPKIPTLDAMQNEINNEEFFGFMIAVGVIPIMILDREFSKDSTIDTVMDGEALSKKRAKVYSTERYQKFMKYSLKRYENLGLFD